MNFEEMAREHWTKYLPAFTRGLKAEGKFEEKIQYAADQAREEYTNLVKGGASDLVARETVIHEYIILPPEDDE